jgi:hypothetical protein
MSYDQLIRPIRAGRGGSYVSRNPDTVSPVFVKEMVNCTLENDAWETEKGTRLLNAVPIANAPTIGTVIQYFPLASIGRLICCGRDGTVWKSADFGQTWELLRSGLEPNKLGVPVECGQEQAGRPKKLIIFGMGQPLVLTGDPTTEAGLADPTELLVGEAQELTGAIQIGLHDYAYTFGNAIGETAPSAIITVDVQNDHHAQVKLTVPRGTDPSITRRVIYRSRANDQVPPAQLATGLVSPASRLKLLTILDNNEDTEYIDNVPDSELQEVGAPLNNSSRSVHFLARPPVDWRGGNYPIAGFLCEGHLAAFGNSNAPHMVYVSSLTDHEDFLGFPFSMSVFSGKGDALTAGVYWRQQAWLFKSPRGIYRIDTQNLDLNQWQVHEHTQAVGGVGPLALTLVQGASDTQFYDDVIFIAPNDGGWHRLSKTDAYQQGDVSASSVSEKTFERFIDDHVDKNRLPFAQLIFFDQVEEVWGAFSEHGQLVNKLRIKMSVRRLPEFGLRFHHSTFPECESLGLAINPDGTRTPIAGGSGGFLKKMHENVYSDAGAPYQASVWTHDDNFQDLGEENKVNRKNFHALLVEGTAVGDWNVWAEVYINGVLQPTLLHFSLLGKGGPFVLDQSRLDQTALGERQPVRWIRRLRGRGYRIAYRFYINPGAEGQPPIGSYFRVTHIHTLYSLGGFSGGNRA